MKKIILIIVITILSILTISLGVGTVYFATNYASAEDKIEDLEDDIDELKEELKDNQNNSYAVSNNSDNSDLYSNDYQEEKEENESYNGNYNNLQEITLADLEYLINKKDNFILLVSQTTCSHCIDYKPTLNSVLNSHNLKAYYIEKNLLTKDENTSFSQIIETPGTPTTAFFIKGVEDQENRIVGNSGESVIEAHLKSAGFIR